MAFREMRRFRQQLTEEECIKILETERRGVLALHGDDDYPYALPLNFIYDGGKIYFHGAKEGHKADAINRDSKCSFCVHDQGYLKDGDWAYYVKSVIVFGRIRMLEDRDETLRIAEKLGMKYFPTAEDVENDLRKNGPRVQIMELTPDHMTGKLVHER